MEPVCPIYQPRSESTGVCNSGLELALVGGTAGGSPSGGGGGWGGRGGGGGG